MPQLNHMIIIDLIIVIVVYTACGAPASEPSSPAEDNISWGEQHSGQGNAQPGSTIPGGGGYGRQIHPQLG